MYVCNGEYNDWINWREVQSEKVLGPRRTWQPTWPSKLAQHPMLGQSSNINARSATLAWCWPLRLRHPKGRLRASHVTLKNYCNKQNSFNIFSGQRKSAGALPAYIHDNSIKMIAIVSDRVGKNKARDSCSIHAILSLSCLVVPSHHQVDNCPSLRVVGQLSYYFLSLVVLREILRLCAC